MADDLAERFGDAHVFRDVEIQPGDDFTAVIRNGVSASSLMLVVIGRDWLNVQDRDGGRRLDQADDWVRLEIETAFECGVAVIPVLVGGALMPDRRELPPSLQPLCTFQAHIMADRSWSADCDRLASIIEERVPAVRKSPPPAEPVPLPTSVPAPRPPPRFKPRAWLPTGRVWAPRLARLAKQALWTALLIALAYFVLENYASPGARQFVYGFFAFLRDTITGFLSGFTS